MKDNNRGITLKQCTSIVPGVVGSILRDKSDLWVSNHLGAGRVRWSGVRGAFSPLLLEVLTLAGFVEVIFGRGWRSRDSRVFVIEERSTGSGRRDDAIWNCHL